MPRVKITHGDRSIELDDVHASMKELYVVAADSLDHQESTGFWLPRELTKTTTDEVTT